ncbi:hypothetical protein K435DRAFT_795800 [Dendrothele bispora CBS 962.96]|uniref:Lysine decarboxylase n=1 Tax=Dendrothele bispora (strain CBS 962.96) TaxID=1314807 RepID=A0A4S8M7N2_DENBC|nr:hypothetical protein K435DRAFT_661149 [Dendrothele bispora CBS 962.96]THU98339.1 hypothetical protein K435DRAFT_795800 [Dendrothele bispora CBS 962.96]
MTTIPSEAALCVYCGASPGNVPEFQAAAISLGQALARSNRPLVYGGSSKGLMGLVSSSCLKAGGEVTGIIPYAMATSGEGTGEDYEQRGRNKTIIVENMHERKMKMAMLSGGFIALPGGYGTLEEIFEVTTWSQLGIHCKPVILLNVNNYYDPLRKLVESAVASGFIRPSYAKLLTFVDAPADREQPIDWGQAALEAFDGWYSPIYQGLFQWSKL